MQTALKPYLCALNFLPQVAIFTAGEPMINVTNLINNHVPYIIPLIVFSKDKIHQLEYTYTLYKYNIHAGARIL